MEQNNINFKLDIHSLLFYEFSEKKQLKSQKMKQVENETRHALDAIMMENI